ncbi:uncharacterized protein EDB91DRAFT_691861 [Suillus paluster]|uniref:uncharacterized protein n=1 Tax=Suillus paluster TaxID=48578 RepID=UPI001B8628DC|nr:uncharacterized protein EDB91DRAFT_691861 [Suillus paluster]KAG1750484.1 hypothetical protein EDB91DRAFT_691861 [Suillus paluster]
MINMWTVLSALPTRCSRLFVITELPNTRALLVSLRCSSTNGNLRCPFYRCGVSNRARASGLPYDTGSACTLYLKSAGLNHPDRIAEYLANSKFNTSHAFLIHPHCCYCFDSIYVCQCMSSLYAVWSQRSNSLLLTICRRTWNTEHVGTVIRVSALALVRWLIARYDMLTSVQIFLLPRPDS